MSWLSSSRAISYWEKRYKVSVTIILKISRRKEVPRTSEVDTRSACSYTIFFFVFYFIFMSWIWLQRWIKLNPVDEKKLPSFRFIPFYIKTIVSYLQNINNLL